MLVKESYLRKTIRESLLLEAVYKLNQLKSLNTKLYELFEKQFVTINNSFTLENDKSPGRFFIDILYQCMKELLSKFDLAIDSNDGNLLESIERICIELILLYQYKETTSTTVQSGETFREYIYAFMLNPTKFMINDLEDMPINDMITKLRYVYTNIMNKAKISGPDRVMQFKTSIKKKDTYYPFGNQLVDGKYLVVQPLNIMSSIFWSRTNIVGEEIILPEQDDTNWCTSRFGGGNLFNTYFVAGGTNLFYFLPKDDIEGRKKFCIGITKVKDKGNEVLSVGGHTTVDFENIPVIRQIQPVNVQLLKEISGKLNVSIETLNKLVDEMDSKEAMDKYKYTSMMDLEQFAAATNIDTIAPKINNSDERDNEGLNNMSTQINNTLEIYKDPEYTNRGYKPDSKVLKYIEKNWLYWSNEGVSLSTKYMPDGLKTSDPDKILELIDKLGSHNAFLYAFDDLKKDIEKMKYLMSKDILLINFADDSIIKELVDLLPLNDPDFVSKYFSSLREEVIKTISQYKSDNAYISQGLLNLFKKSIFKFQYLSEKYRKDKNIVKQFIENVKKSIDYYSTFGSLWAYVPNIIDFFEKNPDILTYYLNYTEGAGVYFFPPILKYDRNFMYKCILKYPSQGLNIPLIFTSYIDIDDLEERNHLMNDKDFWINLIKDIISKKTYDNSTFSEFFRNLLNFIRSSKFSKEKYPNVIPFLIEAYGICKNNKVNIDRYQASRVEEFLLQNQVQLESKVIKKLIMTESELRTLLKRYL